jgi:hypothetical protein
LQLGFAAVDAQEIRRGVQELGLALEGMRKGSPGGAHGANRGAHGVPVLRSARPTA